MGQCAGQKSRKSLPLAEYNKEPKDTESYSNRNLPKLKFQGIMNNLKLKNCLDESASIKVEIQGVLALLLQPKKTKGDQSIQWIFEQKFDFQMTEYQLRKSFLSISIQDQKQETIGNILINLYLISSGPYHQDFAINLNKSHNARISFDMKISQIIQIHLESIEAEINLIKKHPGEKFCYSIKTIVGNSSSLNVSHTSYSVRVMLDEKEDTIEQTKNQILLERKKSVKIAEKQIQPDHNLFWTKEDSLLMPSIAIKTLVSELHHSYFQILLWKIKEQSNGLDMNQTAELFGQCYIALHKVFETDPKYVHTAEGNIVEERVIKGPEKIWHHGKYVGDGSFKFNVVNEKYIKQMQVMVRTEDGVMVYTPVYFDNFTNKKRSESQSLESLIKVLSSIKLNMVKLDQCESLKSQSNFQARKIKIEIERQLQQIIKLLGKSEKQSILCYYYPSQQELMKAQQVFINLGLEMMSWLEEEDAIINQECWQILVALLKRGQFLLAHLMFDTKQKETLKSHDLRKNKNLKTKLQIGLMYQQFLYKQLALSLKSLNAKGQQDQRNFAEIFCAHAYFRIPQFRSKLLKALCKEGDPQINQWRGTDFSLNDDIDYSELKQEINTFTLLCDWLNNFYVCIENQDKAINQRNQLEIILQKDNWQHRFSKRGAAFFYFLVYWVEYIQSIFIKTRDIQWRYFPGYNKIIKCFLVEMKIRPILEYPDCLKLACFKLLSNQKLLNPIVFILFSKSNIYEPLNVIKAIQFIDEILSVLRADKKNIPYTFNYSQFYKGLKIALLSDSSFVICKALLLIYSHYRVFSIEFQRKIALLLLGKLFFRMFLHWSFNVRDIFNHLLLYQIKRDFSNKQAQSTDFLLKENANQTYREHLEQISFRFEHLRTILRQNERLKQQKDRRQIIDQYEKNLYKKLRKRLIRKKKSQKEIIEEEASEILTLCNFPATNSVIQYKQNIGSGLIQKTQRSISEIIEPSIKISKVFRSSRQQEEVIKLRQNNSQFEMEIYDTTKGTRKPMKKFICKALNKEQEQDFQIGRIQANQFQYLPLALKALRKIEEQVEQFNSKENYRLPMIKIQVPLDSKQIRPQSIDDW